MTEYQRPFEKRLDNRYTTTTKVYIENLFRTTKKVAEKGTEIY